MIYKNIIDKINCIEKNWNPIIIWINWVDWSGKTYFSKDLKKYLEYETNKKVILVSVDDFHNPKEIRYKKWKDSAEWFYYDSYNYNELITKLLKEMVDATFPIVKLPLKVLPTIVDPATLKLNDVVVKDVSSPIFRSPPIVKFAAGVVDEVPVIVKLLFTVVRTDERVLTPDPLNSML